jgi:hypothetical protein
MVPQITEKWLRIAEKFNSKTMKTADTFAQEENSSIA